MKKENTKKKTNTKQKDDRIRINKFIASSGYCSRRKADELIADGRVTVNGKIIIELGAMLKPSDVVMIDGNAIKQSIRYKYIILNKPKDFICTKKDELSRKTVFDIVKSSENVLTVGRLDRNTTGVLLLTNDGEMIYRLTHPKYEIERVYVINLDNPLDIKDAQQIAKGVELEDGNTSPCEVVISPEDNKKIFLVLHEGRNREVRRIFEHFGYKVKQLDRKSFAGLSYSGLKKGEYRHLLRTEVNKLKRMLEMN
ncbi:MAG TPA: pseudouridine synthase [Candidatus Kapabacteria bacterium]|nr:pseudouridine synthase [Candidatus Kapabacteria bacterium]HPO63512.1 pseudouridine synthase [Candidatus Kapabacteria bacterium]